MTATLTGQKEVLGNLKRQQRALGLRVAVGLKAAGLALQRESQRLVPVDTGNLKASAFTRATGAGLDTAVTVGYTAAYAMFVHELVQMRLRGQPRIGGKGAYWDPAGRGQAKFLEEPARRMKDELLAIVKKHAKL